MDPDLEIFGPGGWNSDAGIDWTAPIGIDPLLLDGHLGKEVLLVAEPWSVGQANSDGLSVQAPGGETDDWGWSTVRETLYVAATYGRSTDNDDVPPAAYVPGRLLPFNFGIRLFEGVDPTQTSSAASGIVQLADPDGRLDALNGRNWDSVRLTLLRGDRRSQYKDFETVGRFRSAGLLRQVAGEKHLRLRDAAWPLAGPLHGQTYAGTGGLEGDANAAGKDKPWLLGCRYNVPPVLLSQADQVFQWSLSSSVSCIALRHGGVPLTFHADYADYATLAAASIPSGKYGTCLAHSLARPNVTLQYGVTVEAVGDADVVNGRAGPRTRASIVRRIVSHLGTSTLDDATEIDDSAFQRMEMWHSAEVGFFFGAAITKAEAVKRVLAGILGFSRVRPDGRFSIGWLERPELMTPAVTFDFGWHGMGLPNLVDTAPPRQGTRLGWRFNDQPASSGSLALGVTGADYARLSQPATYSQSLRPATATLYPTSPIVTLDDSGFRLQADSDLECERQQLIFDVDRYRWEIDLQVDPHIDLPGNAAAMAGAPQVAGAGRALFCAGINAKGTSVNTFEFFV